MKAPKRIYQRTRARSIEKTMVTELVEGDGGLGYDDATSYEDGERESF